MSQHKTVAFFLRIGQPGAFGTGLRHRPAVECILAVLADPAERAGAALGFKRAVGDGLTPFDALDSHVLDITTPNRLNGETAPRRGR